MLTNRDSFLVDVDLDRLKARISEYFDPDLSHSEILRRYPAAMGSLSGAAASDAQAVRDVLLSRGREDRAGFRSFVYRPFDIRWLYWEPDGGLLDRPRPDYEPHVFKGNLWLTAAQHLRQGATQPQAVLAEHLGSHHLIERGSNLFSAWLREDTLGTATSDGRRPNLSPVARRYLERVNLTVEDLFHHALAVLHSPAYREVNAGALRMEWPRIPMPHWAELTALTGAEENDVAAKADRGCRNPGRLSRSWTEVGRIAQSRDASSRRHQRPTSA